MRRVAQPATGARAGLSSVQKTFLALVVVTLAGSIAWRVAAGASTMSAASLFSGPDATSASSGAGLERYLPYLTQGSLLALVGFALGYATRKTLRFALIVFALALVVLALLFVFVQLLVSSGHVAVDWLGVRSELIQWRSHVRQNETWTSLITHRIPLAGSLLVGYVLGFRRG